MTQMEKLRQIHTRYSRVMTLVLLDIIMVNIVVLGAMWVRLEFSFRLLEESGFVEGYLKVAPVYTVVCLVIFTFFRLYRSLWEYASIDELRYIILAAVAAAAGGCVISNLMGVYLPRSLPVLNGVF